MRSSIFLVAMALAVYGSAGLGDARAQAQFTKRKILNTYIGPVTCKTGAVELVIGADGRQPVEFFYYEHDPRRLWARAGFTYVLGSDTVCQINGLETAHP